MSLCAWKGWAWVAPVVAAMGFAGAVGVFACERASFRAAVIDWARHDLEERTALAAVSLREPLETGDFAALHAFGEACVRDGVHLTITSTGGGLVFDSQRVGETSPESVAVTYPAGEWCVSLALPLDRVLAPFNRAGFGFLLAALAGGAGMLLVFFSTYRQRVRIRELARLERFRREFIADFSHELKTPLTGILGAVDLMSAPTADPALHARLVPLIATEARRLDALTRGILDLSRLEREGETVQRVETDLADLVEETVRALASEAAAKAVRLVCDAPTPAVRAPVDPQLVVQALTNLVANAIRHAQAQEIRVTWRRERQGVRLEVEDDGIGVPVSDRARIFERFARVDASRSTPGTGLGLAIVRRIARLHGGEIVYEPVAPQGSRFVLTLGTSRLT